jgi:DNA-binding transcriptional LysR family regulator
MLRRGEVDLAVVSRPEEGAYADLTYDPLLTDSLAVVAWREHPLAGRRGLGWADLAPHRWVFPGRGEAEREQLHRFFRGGGLPAPVAAVETSSSVLMADVLPGTELLSYLPRRVLRGDRVYAGLVELDVAQEWPAVGIGVAYRRVAVRLPPARNFLAELKRAAAEMTRREPA